MGTLAHTETRAAEPAQRMDIEIYVPATGELERTKEATAITSLPDVMARARAAQAGWAQRSLRERAAVLLRVAEVLYRSADGLAEALQRYNGKSAEEALLSEVYPAAANFRYFARASARHLRPRRLRLGALPLAYSRVRYEPLGVVGVIAPWNYPFLLATLDLPAALMAGNACVIKVSEHAAATGERIEQVLAEARMPAHLVQVIYGFGDLGAALIESGIDKLCFIGSSRVGRLVYAAAAQRMIPVTLELGGKDAALLLEDADLEDAADGILWAGLANCGQACASVELVYVPDALRADFIARLQRKLAALPEESLGAMNVPFQKQLVLEQLRDARERGARVVAERARRGDHPFLLPITFLSDVPDDALLLREETFGPVLAIQGYRSLEEALRRINASPFGLTSSIWTADRRRGQELAHRLQSGTVTINEHMITPGMPEAPWGGWKASGLGVSHSVLSLPAFCRLQYVFHDRGLLRYKFWRFPYSAGKARWLRRFLASQLDPSPWRRFTSLLAAAPRLLLRRNQPLSGPD
ncbi:MAG: aldehyde dehydrogenase family protein [Planctomycetota bacterium]|nr:MAG: aldehyde dehydrogenase family protein [Planctomycetota bacterium]